MASYHMLGSDGKEYGPVSADQLRLWANDGRANAQTQVRDTAGGAWTSFGAVPELNPPPPASGAGSSLPPQSPPPTSVGNSASSYAPGPASYAPAASYAPVANDAETVKYLATTLVSASGWMKFLAVLGFIAGALYVLSIWGILIAWIPIWLGVVLWGAASKAQEASQSGSEEAMNESLNKIRFSFKLHGITSIVIFALFLVMIVIMIIAAVGRAHSY